MADNIAATNTANRLSRNGASTACGFSCHRGLPVLRNRRGGEEILSPKGGKGKKSRSCSPPPPPTRYRSIEFATLSTPFFQLALWLSDVIALKSCFENTRGRETNIRDKKQFLGRLKLVDINRLDNRSKEKEER